MLWRDLEDATNPENSNAGNGGDLVKHTVYGATLEYLLGHDPWSKGIRVRECHAGRGMYRIPSDDAARTSLLRCLCQPFDADTGTLLHDLQRAVQMAMRTWPEGEQPVTWYVGSAALNAWILGCANNGAHQLELYEQAPDTRRILRAVLASCALHRSEIRVCIFPEGEDGSQFDGESHIEDNVSSWGTQDLILLDPFAMWRQPHHQPQRDRYRRIIDELTARDDDSPQLILFWTWGRAFPVARGDLQGTTKLARNGYADMRALLHRADKHFIRVTWCWGLQFAIWVIVPKLHLDALRQIVQERCDQLRDHLRDDGCRFQDPNIDVRVD
jgi:23S rRNA A2030 N6-methylase RlmJ